MSLQVPRLDGVLPVFLVLEGETNIGRGDSGELGALDGDFFAAGLEAEEVVVFGNGEDDDGAEEDGGQDRDGNDGTVVIGRRGIEGTISGLNGNDGITIHVNFIRLTSDQSKDFFSRQNFVVSFEILVLEDKDDDRFSAAAAAGRRNGSAITSFVIIAQSSAGIVDAGVKIGGISAGGMHGNTVGASTEVITVLTAVSIPSTRSDREAVPFLTTVVVVADVNVAGAPHLRGGAIVATKSPFRA